MVRKRLAHMFFIGFPDPSRGRKPQERCCNFTLAHGDSPLFFNLPCRIPNNLPEMAVRVPEVSGIAAPKCILGWFSDMGASFFCLLHCLVYLLFAMDKMAYGEFSCTR